MMALIFIRAGDTENLTEIDLVGDTELGSFDTAHAARFSRYPAGCLNGLLPSCKTLRFRLQLPGRVVYPVYALSAS